MMWLTLGLAGYVALMGYRLVIDGLPSGATPWGYIRGFLLSILLGPICFVFLGFCVIYDLLGNKDD